MRRLIAILALLPAVSLAVTLVAPQVVDGTTWKTTLTVFTRSARAAQVTVTFFNDNGQPMVLPVTGLGPVSTFQLSLGSFDAATVETEGGGSTLQIGWALIESESEIGGVAVFRQRVSGRPDLEAAVPLTLPAAQVISNFDNTGGFSSGIALVNNLGGPIQVNVGFTGEGGQPISTRVITLNARSHMSFALTDRFPELAGKRGTMHLIGTTNQATVEGSISVLGLRFNPSGAFTTLPFFVTIVR
jgi:hypothetical protein